MSLVRRFVKTIRGGAWFVFLICAVFVACIKIPVTPQAPTETSATANHTYLSPQESIPTTDSAYLPPQETVSTTYFAYIPPMGTDVVSLFVTSESKVSPITQKTITPIPITPYPTLTLAPGPSPTPFPLAGIDPKLSDLSMARGKFRETGMDVDRKSVV